MKIKSLKKKFNIIKFINILKDDKEDDLLSAIEKASGINDVIDVEDYIGSYNHINLFKLLNKDLIYEPIFRVTEFHNDEDSSLYGNRFFYEGGILSCSVKQQSRKDIYSFFVESELTSMTDMHDYDFFITQYFKKNEKIKNIDILDKSLSIFKKPTLRELGNKIQLNKRLKWNLKDIKNIFSKNEPISLKQSMDDYLDEHYKICCYLDSPKVFYGNENKLPLNYKFILKF